MPYRLEFLRTAAREFSSLPKSRQRQLARHIDVLADDPFPSGVKKLEGEDKLYRLRVGDYRVVYEVDHEAKAVTVTRLGHRSDIYRNL